LSKLAAIVKTKLYCPEQTAGIVLRERLLDALEGSLERPLTLVCAPAGYGKSVLVSDWARSLEIPVAWVTLDEAESDLRQFLAYVLAALDTVSPGAFEPSLRWLANPVLPGAMAIAHELVNTMLDLDMPFALILDDYHKIDHGSAVHEFVEEILRHPPANFHLVLASRRDPPLALAKLRASDQLLELRQADLRFKNAEAAQLFSAAWGDTPESVLIAELQDAVEGWAAGLRMVVLAAQGLQKSGRPLPILSEGLSQVHEYLLQEVIEALPRNTRYMLILSAIPQKFCAGLLDSLAQTFLDDPENRDAALVDASEFVQQAKIENMFVIALDASGIWYRYHHLFRDFLLQQLEVRFSVEERTLMQAKAASLLEELGMLSDAIDVFVHAGLLSDAAEVVDRYRFNVLDEDHWWLANGWLQALPADQMRKWPGTLLLRAWIAQYKIDLELVSDLVLQLEFIEKEQGLTDSQLGELDYFRGFSMFWSGDIHGARLMFERAGKATMPSETIRGELEAYLAMSRGLDRDKELALQRIQEYKVLDAGKRGGLASRLCAAEFYVNYLSLSIPSARRAVARLAMISTSDFDSGYARGWASLMHGMILFNTGQFQDALVAFKRAQANQRELECRAYMDALSGKAICLAMLDDRENLAKAFAELESTSVSFDLEPEKSQVLASARARCALLQADLETSMANFRELPEADGVGCLFFWLSQPVITHIRVNLARGKSKLVSDALNSILALRESTVAQGLLCQDIDLMLLEAVARGQQGERDVPLALLQEALRHAVPNHWSRPFIELGVLLKPVLHYGTLSEEQRDFLRMQCMLEEFEEFEESESPEQERVSNRVPYTGITLDKFTNRELDILELLAQRYRNKEIAAQLHISTHTVNYHLKHIYQKLDASGRRMAVSRAIELGILAD
jgi:LuxR family maltose regulon positive regulatory protein